MSKNTPAKATVNRVAEALSTVEGRSVSGVANEVGVSTSTARKCLTTLCERGLVRRDERTADWFTVVEDDEDDDEEIKVEAKTEIDLDVVTNTFIDENFETDSEVKIVDVEAFLQGDTLNHMTSETSAVEVLEDLGFSKRLAKQDGALIELLRDHGPLTQDQVHEKLGEFSGWSFRRLTEGRHGDLRFNPLLQAEGHGNDRVYKLANS